MVFVEAASDRQVPVTMETVTMETSPVKFSTTETPRTPALDWKEFFGELSVIT